MLQRGKPVTGEQARRTKIAKFAQIGRTNEKVRVIK